MFWYLSLMHRENSIQPTAGMTSTEFEAAAGPPASALPSGSGARGAPNPPAPLDLPMPDQPTGPPGPSQAVISPLSSYPPANSAGGPDIPNRSTSSPDERQGRSNSRSQETHRPDQQHYPSQRNEPSLQHTSRRDESFKVVRGNSGRDVRANQSSNTAATLANHRKHEGKDVPWEQPRRDERNTSNVPEKPMQRPRRDASLQASNASATGRPLLHRSPEGSTTGHQEHIVV